MARVLLTAAIVAGGPAAAQTPATGVPARDPAPTGDRFLCSELAAMDHETASAALYFMVGYGVGRTSRDTADGGPGDTAAPVPAPTASAGSDADDTTDGDTAPDTSAAAERGTDLTAAVQDETVEVRMSGFYEIPVERVVNSCATTPERRVTEVIEEERG